MRKSSFILGILALALVFGLVLTGCNLNDDDGSSVEPVPESNAQVYWMDGKANTGNETVNLVYWAEGSDVPQVIGTAGTVTNGKLTLSLPPSVAEQYLDSGSYWMEQLPGVTITPSDVQIRFDVDFLFDDAIIGFEKGSDNTTYRVLYYYFSKEATITGTVSNTNGSDTRTYNVSAKAGWNWLYRSSTKSGNTRTTTITTDLSKIPSGLRWVIDRNSPSDDNDDDAYAGTWTATVKDETTGQDIPLKIVAADGSWNQYMVINDLEIELSCGTYTVLGASVTSIATKVNTLMFDGANNLVDYSSLTDEQKEKLGSPTVTRTISGDEFTVESVTYRRQ
jgi:hypothetical protein